MPIKRRASLGGAPKPTAETPKAKPVVNKRRVKQFIKKPAEPKTEKPKPKLAAVKKRRLHPNSKSEFVYPDDAGRLVVKTPASCTRWSQAFRMRIIADWIGPKTLMSGFDFERRYLEGQTQRTVYNVEGHRLMVRNPFEVLPPNKVVVLRTEVIDLDRKRGMFLHHQDPAFRVLMVYSFIHDKSIGGVPRADVYEYNSGD